jgi:succinylglutamate desuccinylase
MPNKIRRVAIVGGTHGNEWTGIYLVRKFQQFPQGVQRSTFETVTLLANPKAIELNQRYVDRDLNRCFGSESLNNPELTGYEPDRAKSIAQQFNHDSASRVDVIIDLHSTTANMGMTLLPTSQHPFNLQLMAHLSEQDPSARVCLGLKSSQENPMLRSLVPFGCTIEVGSIAQGVLDAHWFQQTERMIHRILDYLEAINQEKTLTIPASFTAYQSIESIDYPRNTSGELAAMIHPGLQGRDYQPLEPGDPMFLTWAGETICYSGDAIVYPIFINEAAYYEKGIAMTLTKPVDLRIGDI